MCKRMRERLTNVIDYRSHTEGRALRGRNPSAVVIRDQEAGGAIAVRSGVESWFWLKRQIPGGWGQSPHFK